VFVVCAMDSPGQVRHIELVADDGAMTAARRLMEGDLTSAHGAGIERKTVKRIITIAVAALALAVPVAPSVTASAAVAPLPKIQAYRIMGWSGMVRRPAEISVVMTGGPDVIKLKWSRWTASSAKATGRIQLWFCTPIATCPPTVHNVTVWAQNPRKHRALGYPYFSTMVWRYFNRHGVAKTPALPLLYSSGRERASLALSSARPDHLPHKNVRPSWTECSPASRHAAPVQAGPVGAVEKCLEAARCLNRSRKPVIIPHRTR